MEQEISKQISTMGEFEPPHPDLSIDSPVYNEHTDCSLSLSVENHLARVTTLPSTVTCRAQENGVDDISYACLRHGIDLKDYSSRLPVCFGTGVWW